MAEKPFTSEDLKDIRSRAEKLLKGLEQSSPSSPSWINKEKAIESGDDTRSAQCRYFDAHGFLRVSNFVDDKEIEALKGQMKSLAGGWDAAADSFDSFGTDNMANKARGDYFLESASKVHFFAETTAIEETDQGKRLKPHYQSNKMAALNKAGHAMHMIPGAFRDYALSDKIRTLVLDLGWRDPVVPQSMYIFKQPLIGGTVTSHQDSTFLYTHPKQSCLGLWLALDDASLDNGCLWVRPGSHWEPTRRQYKRNPEHFGKEAIERRSNDAAGDLTATKLVMENIPPWSEQDDKRVAPWEGALPEGGYEGLFQAGFVPVECKAGDLVVFPGELDHLSLPNFSKLPRHTFQLHLVEGERSGVTWSIFNWLQYPTDLPFMQLVNS